MNRLSAILIAIILLLSQITVYTTAKTPANDTIIIAGSDFQHQDGNDSSADGVSSVINAMKKDNVNAVDALLFCGDYDYDTYGDTSSTNNGINSLKKSINTFVNGQIILAQGNHDTAAGSNGMSMSGSNDPSSQKYGVFLINNDDYMWKNTDENTIKSTAEKLKNYLLEKSDANFTKPIFIVSHLSLHYSMRTANDGDGMYAGYIFDVINHYSKKGLNIIYLFGHNHSNGWDDYLGGSSIYLKKGDKILIAENDKKIYKEETLSFTYMNAGYVGYYENHNGADDTLTMTLFKFNTDQLEIYRYSKNGKHNLKSEGVRNAYKDETGYLPNKTVYESPQVMSLKDNVNTITPLPYLLVVSSALITIIIAIKISKKR